MLTFAKSQVAASVASAADWGITVLLVEVIGFWYVAGNAIGTASGGLLNFYLNRHWTFPNGISSRNAQLIRYAIVWLGYLILSSVGLYLLTHFAGLHYLVAKIAVSLTLAFGYNYPLQKHFVFK